MQFKQTLKKYYLSLIPLLLLMIGTVTAVYLSGQKTQTQQKASSSQVYLDPRLGVTHAGDGSYPQVSDIKLYGAQDALSLGFQSIELYFPVNLSQKDMFQPIFSLPFKTFFVSAEELNADAAAEWKLLGPPFTTAQTQNLYTDYYNLTQYLLTTWNNTNKTFIIQSSNEMDWQILPTADPALDPSDNAIQNAITYWSTIQNAINDAKKATPATGVKVYQGCEVNLVQKAMQGKKTATNNVIPFTHCDLIGYSSWDTINVNPAGLPQALDYMASKAPDNPDYGSKNVYMSESGAPESASTGGAAGSVTLMRQVINLGLGWGVPYLNYWELYSGCSVTPPTTYAQCPGYWIRKPNLSNPSQKGPLADVYNQVYLQYQVAAPTPTVTYTPTPSPTVTPTRIPSVTPTPTGILPTSTQSEPTNTPVPTSIPVPGHTTLGLTLSLQGVGTASSGANTQPLHQQRQMSVQVFDTTNRQVGTDITTTVTFDKSTGLFTGVVDAGTLSSRIYTVKVKTDRYLRKLVSGIQTITKGQPNIMPQTTLTVGDINNDNFLNIPRL